MPADRSYEVIIIGGGPAGLNAAVVLGRCRRKVLLIDAGRQRNLASHGIHNYLTRDHILPKEFLAIVAQELKKYKVPVKKTEILAAQRTSDGRFLLQDREGLSYSCAKLVIATGLKDRLPGIPGLREFFGRSVFHCPYCDGWEVKDKRVAVIAEAKKGIELATSLTTWSTQVSLFTHGNDFVGRKDNRLLARYNIPVFTTRIRRLVGTDGMLNQIVLESGQTVACEAAFLSMEYEQQSSLAQELGCRVSSHGVVLTTKSGRTKVPGLYVVGDASWDIHLVVIAAAEGAKAGVYINKQLQKEEKAVRLNKKSTQPA
ncbi:MAG TPA: NAD(P)/FAD-dependent oxidoreductase [Chitinophagaceae bacterium]|nr:NAD(P)/FAD-dependent oxidoreductase [Chitinophagaceae bacterium]